MSEQLQLIIVIAFGGLCFGCGYLAGFIVTRNHWRNRNEADYPIYWGVKADVRRKKRTAMGNRDDFEENSEAYCNEFQ